MLIKFGNKSSVFQAAYFLYKSMQFLKLNITVLPFLSKFVIMTVLNGVTYCSYKGVSKSANKILDAMCADDPLIYGKI